MDESGYISILCTQSEYVAVLAKELTITLKTLRNALREPPTHSHITTSTQRARLAELQRLLTGEVELLNQQFMELFPSQVDSRTPQERKEDSQPHSVATRQPSTLRESATEVSHRTHVLFEVSRAAMAFATHTFECTREVLQQKKAIFQSIRASRERAAEWKAQASSARPVSPIDQEEHSPPARPTP